MKTTHVVLRKNKKERTLQPVQPSIGLEVIFREKLQRLVEKMHKSVMFWIVAAYRAEEPVIAQDELPARRLRRSISRVAKRWQDSFDEAAPELADYFSREINDRSDAALKRILKKGGFSVKFKMTRAQRDIMQASINQQIQLIKSIPNNYLAEVEGKVMRAVQTGRDLGELSKDLERSYGVTKRRAALIARDQNNKATAAMTRARQVELGITEAIWVHSGGGKRPRPTHVKAGKDKVRYDTKKGWYDPHEKKFIFPGELINCRCVSRAVIPGF